MYPKLLGIPLPNIVILTVNKFYYSYKGEKKGKGDFIFS